MLKTALVACGVLVSALGISVEAKATFNFYFDVLAQQDNYSPIALGEDLTVDACGSTLHRATHTPNSQPSYGFCTLSNTALENFEFTWSISQNGVTSTLAEYTGSNAVHGLTPTFSTGAGTLISQVGNYTIGLLIHTPEFWNDVLLPDGNVARAWCDPGVNIGGVHYGPPGTGCSTSGYTTNGYRNTSFAQASLSVTAPVPEPETALILIPALLIAMRRRRKTLA
ncbi:hypothetical protein KFE96_09750 [Kordiimonas sp. SCSIO 12603]|uniref:hypothetical protein n=1 Tax=Kordiimonas sp. SCSIO 12603 TaxID=2829596 RepID=UPI0021041BF2|nr:hypothetical protein [Kordiimonas sp. SCSIO 12603]UTW57149.1 hypothetical protein KFE96_09750 [Kordiimonas sp. SCSIO 12603]